METTNKLAFAAIAAAALVAGCAELRQSAGGQSSYASVNGLRMYYEIHGTGRPLVLLHGAFCTIEACFGHILPPLAKGRQVVAIEQQAHGRTVDLDRPLTTKHMAEDTMALLRHLKIKQADFLGYSMGAGIALQIAIRQPDLVRKLVFAAYPSSPEGFHPGFLEEIAKLTPQDFVGSPWLEAYRKVAPNPEDFPRLLARVQEQTRTFEGWPSEAVRSITAPTLILMGDSDITRPEHAVHTFRLLGGGAFGGVAGAPPRSQLAMLPGTTHVTLLDRTEWLVSMITRFLDAPVRQ